MTKDGRSPINPARHKDGWLLALEPWLGKQAAMPVAIGLDDLPDDGESWDLEIDVRSDTTSVYAKLGVSAIVGSHASWDSTTASWEMMLGVRKVLDPDDITDELAIYETFWGVGLRVLVTAKTTEIGLDVNAGIVAAQAEYGSASVQYEVRGVGLGPGVLANMLQAIPPFGTFDLKTQDALAKIRENLKQVLKTELSKSETTLARLQPVVIMMSAKDSPERDDLGDAAVYHFAMRKIAAGLSYDEAVKNSRNYVLPPPDVVRPIYLDLAGVDDPLAKPTSAAKDRARSWLVVPL